MAPQVLGMAERLQADGLKVWFDEWLLKPGDSIPAKIEDGLEQSRVLVLCMSAHAFGSDWAQLETGTFRFRDPLNKERRFIPLRLDDAPMLRRQQAEAVIAARRMIVHGAVSMVEMALKDLADRQVLTLDDERKAAMVSNLLVVLCGEAEVHPIVNTRVR